MMMMVMMPSFPETLLLFNELTLLIAREYFINGNT
jgi:hypothetical protein